jgi:hypothetical protein
MKYKSENALVVLMSVTLLGLAGCSEGPKSEVTVEELTGKQQCAAMKGDYSAGYCTVGNDTIWVGN